MGTKTMIQLPEPIGRQHQPALAAQLGEAVPLGHLSGSNVRASPYNKCSFGRRSLRSGGAVIQKCNTLQNSTISNTDDQKAPHSMCDGAPFQVWSYFRSGCWGGPDPAGDNRGRNLALGATRAATPLGSVICSRSAPLVARPVDCAWRWWAYWQAVPEFRENVSRTSSFMEVEQGQCTGE